MKELKMQNPVSFIPPQRLANLLKSGIKKIPPLYSKSGIVSIWYSDFAYIEAKPRRASANFCTLSESELIEA